MRLGRNLTRVLRVFRRLSEPRNAGAFAVAVAAGMTLSSATQDANANGETRSISMVHAHTGEALTVTYRRNGSFDSAALEKLNWFLRDWRVDEPTSMAPNLFDIIWHVYREVGASEPVKVMSAYRSPGTNAMLRRRSRAVAKESQHMRGNAMDIHIPGVSMSKAREIGMRLHAGGVGYYPSAGSPFVHLDVGSVRSWPRMPRDQLERMFPDGKTVHLPADGIPLANYELALAEVQARGGSALDYATVTTNRGKSLWALLFGGDEDEDVKEAGRGTSRAASRGRSGQQPVEVATASSVDNVMNPGRVAPVSLRPAPPVPAPAPASEAVPGEGQAAVPAPRQATPEKQEPLLQIAALPVPPIRPRGAQLEKLIAAGDPLPPIRPSSLNSFAAIPPTSGNAGAASSAVPGTVTSGASAQVAVAAVPAALVPVPGTPLPPQRPTVVATIAAPSSAATVLQPVAAPLPPLRPAIAPTEVAALPGIISGARPEASSGTLVQSYAAIAAPLPPSRPAARIQPVAQAGETPKPADAVAPTPSPVAAPRVAAAPVPRREPAKVQVQVPPASKAEAALAGQSSVDVRPANVQAVAEPLVDHELRSRVVAMRFTQRPASAGANGFGGAFIRPLGASFTRSGE